jgi:hypothetical protein
MLAQDFEGAVSGIWVPHLALILQTLGLHSQNDPALGAYFTLQLGDHSSILHL